MGLDTPNILSLRPDQTTQITTSPSRSAVIPGGITEVQLHVPGFSRIAGKVLQFSLGAGCPSLEIKWLQPL